MKINQIKYGVVLSYALIIVNAMYGLLMAPYILSQIGEGDYGVYKTVAAFSSTLTVLDLGIGTTVMRYTAKFRAERKTEEISNFAAMGLLEAGIMALVVSFVCTAIYTYLPTFYSDVFTGREIKLARTLFLILSAKGRVARRGDEIPEVLCSHQNLYARTSTAQFKQQQICAQTHLCRAKILKTVHLGGFLIL